MIRLWSTRDLGIRLADTRTSRGVVVSNRLCCCNRMSIAFVATLLNDTEKISMTPTTFAVIHSRLSREAVILPFF